MEAIRRFVDIWKKERVQCTIDISMKQIPGSCNSQLEIMQISCQYFIIFSRGETDFHVDYGEEQTKIFLRVRDRKKGACLILQYPNRFMWTIRSLLTCDL